ncbi:MAG: YbhB/YbcL family Raf kinase inhibitor-like protein [Thermoplasmata archaeon]|nr:YbhB/YbcL family Raf kinase inhibitor-like protein [Thermoplasmata archaeon]
MKVECSGIGPDGWFDDRFGAKGSVFVNGMPGLSPGFSIKDAPEGTKSFAVVFDDYDAVSAAGFLWVHWLISDLKETEVKEGASHNDPPFTEGSNNWFSALGDLTREQATGYGGPAPPNGMHRYTLKVYALDTVLDLPSGFRLNDLYFAMDGHVLAHCKAVGKYSTD